MFHRSHRNVPAPRRDGRRLACAAFTTFAALGLAVLAATAWARRENPPTYDGFAVCGSPGDRCDSPAKAFDPFELPFRLPARLKANALYVSEPFYAVVLRRERAEPACDRGEYSAELERFRVAAQARFPGRKVFADHQCPNLSAVGYELLDARRTDAAVSFAAVYAGKTAANARPVLEIARRLYPGAALRRVRVNYSRIVQ